jgi:DNA-binding XRE family transcriptional regulator
MEGNIKRNVTDFEDILKEKYREKGSMARDKFDGDSLAFRLGVMLKEARQEARITQEQLAEKTGTRKSYISRIERVQSDIRISTCYKLTEVGLGRQLNISRGSI